MNWTDRLNSQASSEGALWKRCLNLAKFVSRVSARRAIMTFGLQAVGNVTEGLSVILLLPLFQFIGKGGSGTLLHLPTAFLAPVLGPTFNVELWIVLCVFVILIVLIALFNKFKAVYAAELFSQTINTIRTDLFKSIARAKWFTIATMRKADLDHALTGDIDRVQVAITSLYSIGQNLVFFCLYFGLSALISLKMTAFASAAGLLVFLVQRPIRIYAADYGQRLTRQRQLQYRTIANFLSGLKVAKGFNAEEKYIEEFDANLSKMRSDTLRFVAITSNGSIVYQAILGSLMCAFIYISYAIYNIEFSKIIILLIIFTRISPRMADLQSQVQSLLLNLSPFETIQNLKSLCDLHEESYQLKPASTVGLKDRLVFSNVNFAYDEANVIRNVSFEIPFGSVTGLSGQSGSGKSTIADLAMGLLIPSTGEIRLDENVLDNANRRAWRSRTAYVPQESHLLSTSLRENLTLAAPGASDEEIRVALSQARALSFVNALPRGLDTLVGDGGSNLSGGERQRIALARALLKRPDLLILDEVTSALDNENTRGIVDTIKSLKGQMTILLITHNEAVLESASQVILLDKGTVVTQGVQ